MPVLYLIHGGGDVDNAWATVGCAGNILDNLLYEGKIVPMIVVMPNGFINIETESMLEKLPVFTQELMDNIIPFIEANYRVYKNPKHRALMGLSFGGLEVLEVVTCFPEKFDYVGIMSSGWWISDSWRQQRGNDWMDNKQQRINIMNSIGKKFNKTIKLMYFTMGGPEDLAYENGIETMEIFRDAGVDFKYSESPGGHTWNVWRKNLWEISPLLFK